MENKLLPCPFCGGEAEVWSHYYDELDMRLWQVRCRKRPYEAENACYASESFISFETEAEAIEAWNTRAERTCAFSVYKTGDKHYPTCSACGYEAAREECEDYVGVVYYEKRHCPTAAQR